MACAGGTARHSVGGADGTSTVCDSFYSCLILRRVKDTESGLRAVGLSRKAGYLPVGPGGVCGCIVVLVDGR